MCLCVCVWCSSCGGMDSVSRVVSRILASAVLGDCHYRYMSTCGIGGGHGSKGAYIGLVLLFCCYFAFFFFAFSSSVFLIIIICSVFAIARHIHYFIIIMNNTRS